VVIRQVSALSQAEGEQVRELAERIKIRDGAPPLSDQALANLRQTGRGDLDHLLVTDADTDIDGEAAQLVGYAQRDGVSVELAADPLVLDLLLRTLESRADGSPLLVWSHGERSPVAAAAHARGFYEVRRLWQLRRSLNDLDHPPAPGDSQLPVGVIVRTFEVGVDEPAWLSVNNAAFAKHAEQGRWTLADLEAREAEPWFDPTGFFLAERAGELLGFHWTKVHPDGTGEVYVLAVAPSAQGLHLGAILLGRGLAHLAGRGANEVLLYVDDDNPTAMNLYRSTGFVMANLDTSWHSPE
jgi:mycothiol synthase